MGGIGLVGASGSIDQASAAPILNVAAAPVDAVQVGPPQSATDLQAADVGAIVSQVHTRLNRVDSDHARRLAQLPVRPADAATVHHRSLSADPADLMERARSWVGGPERGAGTAAEVVQPVHLTGEWSWSGSPAAAGALESVGHLWRDFQHETVGLLGALMSLGEPDAAGGDDPAWSNPDVTAVRNALGVGDQNTPPSAGRPSPVVGPAAWAQAQEWTNNLITRFVGQALAPVHHDIADRGPGDLST